MLVLTAPTGVTNYGRVILYAPPGGRNGIGPTVLVTTGVTNMDGVFGTNNIRTVNTVTCKAKDIPGMCGVFNPNGRFIVTTGRRISLRSITVSVPTKPSRIYLVTSRATGPIFTTTSLLSRTRRNFSSRIFFVAASRGILRSIGGRIRVRLRRLPHGRVTRASLSGSGFVLIGSRRRTVSLYGACTPRRLVVTATSCRRLTRGIIGTNDMFLNGCTYRDTNSCTDNAGRALPARNCTLTCGNIGLSDCGHGVAFRRLARRNVHGVNSTIIAVTRGRRLRTRTGTVELEMGDLGWGWKVGSLGSLYQRGV